MFLGTEGGEAGQLSSSQGTPIFKDAFFIISCVFTAKQSQPLWPLHFSDLPCWDALVKLMLRGLNQILFKHVRKQLKASSASGGINGLVWHSSSSRDTDFSQLPASVKAVPMFLGPWVSLSLGSFAFLSPLHTLPPTAPVLPGNDKSMVIA